MRSHSNLMMMGIIAIVVGILAVGGGVIYLVVQQEALDELNEFVVAVPTETRDAWVQPPVKPTATAATTVVASVDSDPEVVSPIEFDFAGLYPADQTNPRFWSDPLFAGTGPFGGPTIPDGFEFVSNLDALRKDVVSGEPKMLLIPSIGLIAPVAELIILEEESGARYEQPVNLVGHIPETPNPGQPGNGWYFGHLESPILGEGNIFNRLPDIVEMIKNDPVDVIIETDNEAFLYRVTGSNVIPKEDIELYRSDTATVTLVASFPSRVYSHRLLITAELIAAKLNS
ncbi:MAG: sortase [Chloroflexi bacterium]|nr:sortase [Chloroflexota bacterium]